MGKKGIDGGGKKKEGDAGLSGLAKSSGCESAKPLVVDKHSDER